MVIRRAEWLDLGLVVVAAAGAGGLRVDRLAGELGVTKGSFYHHFVDLADYRRALLGHFEERCTTRHIRANETLGDLAPRERLLALADTVLADERTHRGLEVGVRVWATQDDDARDTLERVDSRRLAYLEELALALVDDAERAVDLAGAIYYLLIGSQHAVPPGSTAQLRRLWQDLLLDAERRAAR